MKKTLFPVLAAVVLLTGCSSVSVLSRNVPANASVVPGGKTVAAYEVHNTSYRLLGCIPLGSGVTWKEGAYDGRSRCNWTAFSDHCTLDENLASVKAAAREVGTDRVDSLVNVIDESSAWSCFLITCRSIKTTCLFLEPSSD